MKRTIFNPNGIAVKDMLEIMYYCKGFIEITGFDPEMRKKDAVKQALNGCISLGKDILEGTLEGNGIKASSLNVTTFVTICYFAYKQIDMLQNHIPKAISKDLLHDNANEIKEKARKLVLDINETLYNSGDIELEAYLLMKKEMKKGK